MRVVIAVLTALACGCTHAAASEGTTAAASAAPRSRLVAVLELHSKLAGAERSAVDAGYLANAVRAQVLKSGASVRVLTRENMLVLLQATGRKLEECEGECEVETGRRLGADLVVSGDLLRFGSSYKLDLRLHDTGSGELLAGAAASGETVDRLDQAVGPAVDELLAPLRPAAPSAARDAISGFPASAQCQGRLTNEHGVFATRGSMTIDRSGPNAARFRYQAVRTGSDASSTHQVDGEWHVEPSTGVFTAHASDNFGARFTGSSPGWQGEVMIEVGDLQTASETLPYRSTWTRRGPRRFALRFELMLKGKWVTTAEDECSE